MGFDTAKAGGQSIGIKGGPGMKMARAESVDQMHKFETFAERVSITKGCELSLKCVASGIRCWGAIPSYRRGSLGAASIFLRWRNFPAMPPLFGKSLQPPGIQPRMRTDSCNAGS